MKTTFAFLLTVFLALQCLAQAQENDAAMYDTYLSKDATTLKQQWKKIVEDRQAQLKKNSADKNLQYNLALAQYGLLSATMRDMDEDLFDEYVDGAEDN